ncbi:MAG: hypothetical protein HGA85_05435 [Nanoarchaeota archaeon]|nr:hypothetical protein [Nanoarchaeota archaeon]
MAEQLVIIPALLFGAIIGLVEMFFVHSDEIGMGWFSHGLHALPFAILFTMVSMNVGWALGLLPGKLVTNMWIDLGVRAAVAVLAMLKISAAAAIAGRVGERLGHVVVIGILIFLAPYVWKFIGPFIPLPKVFGF